MNTEPDIHAPSAPATARDSEGLVAEGVDINQIVAYNLAEARRRRGWTQTQTAARLETVLGRRMSQATMSAMERTYDGPPAGRRRQFDAQDLGAFSKVFGVPIVLFFLPPPGDQRRIAGVPYRVDELATLVMGTEHQQDMLHERLRQIGEADPRPDDELIALHTGGDLEEVKRWRRVIRQRLYALVEEHADTFDRAVGVIAEGFEALRQASIVGYLEERSDDS